MSQNTSTQWNQLFLEYSESSWDSLFRFSFSLCKDESEAEDLVQQTLLKALQSFPSFFKSNYSAHSEAEAREMVRRSGEAELREHLLNWMMKICKNTFLDERSRASRRYHHVALDEWADDPAPGDAQKHHRDSGASGQNDENVWRNIDSEQAFFEHALDDAWKVRFEQLNARQRSMIYLAAEDYSYKEIARLLDIPIGTVMSTLSRAIQKLKKQEREHERNKTSD